MGNNQQIIIVYRFVDKERIKLFLDKNILTFKLLILNSSLLSLSASLTITFKFPSNKYVLVAMSQ